MAPSPPRVRSPAELNPDAGGRHGGIDLDKIIERALQIAVFSPGGLQAESQTCAARASLLRSALTARQAHVRAGIGSKKRCPVVVGDGPTAVPNLAKIQYASLALDSRQISFVMVRSAHVRARRRHGPGPAI